MESESKRLKQARFVVGAEPRGGSEPRRRRKNKAHSSRSVVKTTLPALQTCGTTDRTEYMKRAAFNYRLYRVRRPIENSFGILANRWHILRRILKASEDKTKAIIGAFVELHNMLEESAISISTHNPPGYVDSDDREGNVTDGAWQAENDGLPILQDQQGHGYHSARLNVGFLRTFWRLLVFRAQL
ncbi:hypothetical protein HPB50_007928 [Hyalomma asiaticum]|uniref:Uncharacterized protein n=1 Tax=Hyalomma asiaticum TaxID=266040 RepID=A0ACB7S8J7_HYAAI|nr:hypothetical protein HPB50_007928 [Hyalomma asiaticum]